MSDHHTVPFFDVETHKYFKRTVRESDVFSLYEWADHMMSVSNNGAASVLWREVVLMRAFGKDYSELTEEQAETYFKETPGKKLTDIAISVVNDPLRELEISEDEWRLGSLFYRRRKKQNREPRREYRQSARLDEMDDGFGKWPDRRCPFEPGDQAPPIHHRPPHPLRRDQ